MERFWEKTIKTYENIITYPKLTEKYLKRPPFKYLLQIFISLNKKTGFADGLYQDEELKNEFYSTPEKKLNFLKKIMRLVMRVGEKELIVKPQSIIKGIDCDKTNIFLQEMARVATKLPKNADIIKEIVEGKKQVNEKIESSSVSKKIKKERPGEKSYKKQPDENVVRKMKGKFDNKIIQKKL